MRKKRIRDRLQLLNDAGPDYLNFLRNLTPQIVLLTAAILFGSTLDSWNLILVFSFTIILGAFALAFYINVVIFYRPFFAPWKAWRTKLRQRLTKQGMSNFRRARAMLHAIWKFRIIEFAETVVVFYFFLFALFVVVVMSMTSFFRIH